jgi:hypothetical protein
MLIFIDVSSYQKRKDIRIKVDKVLGFSSLVCGKRRGGPKDFIIKMNKICQTKSKSIQEQKE